jgi:hypothetical protein
MKVAAEQTSELSGHGGFLISANIAGTHKEPRQAQGTAVSGHQTWRGICDGFRNTRFAAAR